MAGSRPASRSVTCDTTRLVSLLSLTLNHHCKFAMYSASPPYQCPSTPFAATQAHRRRSQYKTLTFKTPTRIFSNSGRSTDTDWGHHITTPSCPDSPKLSLRNRFKARCFERAAKARERAVKGKRFANQLSSSSDDFIMEDDDDEEDDEDIMQDEVRVFSVVLLLGILSLA